MPVSLMFGRGLRSPVLGTSNSIAQGEMAGLQEWMRADPGPVPETAFRIRPTPPRQIPQRPTPLLGRDHALSEEDSERLANIERTLALMWYTSEDQIKETKALREQLSGWYMSILHTEIHASIRERARAHNESARQVNMMIDSQDIETVANMVEFHHVCTGKPIFILKEIDELSERDLQRLFQALGLCSHLHTETPEKRVMLRARLGVMTRKKMIEDPSRIDRRLGALIVEDLFTSKSDEA